MSVGTRRRPEVAEAACAVGAAGALEAACALGAAGALEAARAAVGGP